MMNNGDSMNFGSTRLSRRLWLAGCAIALVVALVASKNVAAAVSGAEAAASQRALLGELTQQAEPRADVLTRHLTVVAGLNGVQFRGESSDATSRILQSGTALRATARTEDSRWLYVTVDDESGWIASDDVIAFGISAIPVKTLPDLVMDGLDDDMATETSETSETSEGMDGEGAGAVGQADNAPSASTAATSAAQGADTTNTAEAPIADAVEVPVAETASVLASLLNVRAGPSTDDQVVGQVVQNQQLPIIGISEDEAWLQVVFSDGEEQNDSPSIGWVAAGFVQTGTLEPAAIDSDNVAESAAAASGDAAGSGGTLVFQQSIGGAIYAYSLRSGALRQLTTGAEPALSPDGQTVAFTRQDGLYLIDLAGTNERLVFSGREGLGSPKWSPDGSTLIFTRGDEWLACVKWGGVKENCTEDNEVGEGKYKKILYAIAAVDADGGNYRDVVSTKPARAPDWTSAGIIYQSIDGLQLTHVDRDAVNSLIDYDYLDPFYYDPDKQPNGGQIVFQSKEGSHWQIFTINDDGSGRRALTRPRTALVDELPSSVSPAFSPDGRQIVYVSNMTNSGEAGPWRLWLMNADGSNQRQLPINVTIDYTYGVEQVVSWQ